MKEYGVELGHRLEQGAVGGDGAVRDGAPLLQEGKTTEAKVELLEGGKEQDGLQL